MPHTKQSVVSVLQVSLLPHCRYRGRGQVSMPASREESSKESLAQQCQQVHGGCSIRNHHLKEINDRNDFKTHWIERDKRYLLVIIVWHLMILPTCTFIVETTKVGSLGGDLVHQGLPCTTVQKPQWKFGRTRNIVGTRAAGEFFHSFF